MECGAKWIDNAGIDAEPGMSMFFFFFFVFLRILLLLFFSSFFFFFFLCVSSSPKTRSTSPPWKRSDEGGLSEDCCRGSSHHYCGLSAPDVTHGETHGCVKKKKKTIPHAAKAEAGEAESIYSLLFDGCVGRRVVLEVASLEQKKREEKEKKESVRA